jgi:ubiquinone/menaquinone biosynthesis C-methylase UbiE
MGFYSKRIVPYLVAWTCGTKGLVRWREKTCAGLAGSVLEIGFGSGTNIAHLPASVEQLYAVEPSTIARKLARHRIESAPFRVSMIGLDGESLPMADDSCDFALCTFTLCTVANPQVALREIYRVLRPGGRLHLLEHGIAPDPGVARWQHRLNGIERRVADGCNLVRDPLALLNNAGFETVWSEQRYARGPKPWSYFTVAVVAKPLGKAG